MSEKHILLKLFLKTIRPTRIHEKVTSVRLAMLFEGRFPFDQIFRFEIPGIPCDEWNSIFCFVGLTRPRSSGSKFSAKISDQTEDSFMSFNFVYLRWGCSTTLKLK